MHWRQFLEIKGWAYSVLTLLLCTRWLSGVLRSILNLRAVITFITVNDKYFTRYLSRRKIVTVLVVKRSKGIRISVVYQLVGYYVTRECARCGIQHLIVRLTQTFAVEAYFLSHVAVDLLNSDCVLVQRNALLVVKVVAPFRILVLRRMHACCFSEFHAVWLRTHEGVLRVTLRRHHSLIAPRLAAVAPPKSHNLIHHRHQRNHTTQYIIRISKQLVL